MRVALDIPTVALRWDGTVAHIPTSPGQIYFLSGEEEWQGQVNVACHEDSIERQHRTLDVNPDLPLCSRCQKAMKNAVGIEFLEGDSTTYKRGSRTGMSDLDTKLARVYDRLRKRGQRQQLGDSARGGLEDVYRNAVGDALDAVRKELI